MKTTTTEETMTRGSSASSPPTRRTEMTSVTELPAERLSDEQFFALPELTDPQVGDKIALYSRGSIRVGIVEKVGRTNVTAVYTTEGAWDTARKTHQALSDPTRAARAHKWMLGMAAKNYDFHVRESDPNTAQYAVEKPWDGGPAKAEAERARHAELIAGLTKDEYVAQEAEKERERRQAEYDEAIAGGVAQYVHATRKSVKMTDARLIERARRRG